MDLTNGDISHLVFRRKLRDDLGSVNLTSQMLTVLVSLDGKQNLGTLAARLGLPMGAVRQAVVQLHGRDLVEPAPNAVPLLSQDFFAFMRAQLALAIGPIAEVIIEDAVADLGHQIARFPIHRAAELVDLLSREIQREEKRSAFQRGMVLRLREEGP